ncbi:ABC transporter permease [Noviherbaspirillum denitrificans]|uniref:Taurine ABC transporter permease n=1 Tax=Noviherbaspirillum denitrificans TaxID=1968433 RepID=A0A254TGP3_9BURK|nr:ABC transporter permease [Noviherbaspirillum denitrificans]OWW21800.1 taurine ABC transporter permease [Noviherbaspirillum denitrificans]
MKNVHRTVLSIVTVGLVVGIWQLSGSLSWVDPLLLPPPSDIGIATAELLDTGYRQIPLWEHVLVSVLRALAAFAAAIATGIPLGLAMGRSPLVSAMLEPFVQFLRPLPKIALIPLTVVWFGIGEGSKFFLIFISCFLSVVVSAAAAVAGVSQNRVRAAQSLGASGPQIFLRVVLPNALPEIFTGVRLSVGIGWTSLIAAEMVAATSGLGWMVVNAGSYMRTDVVMLGILLLGTIGYLFDLLLVGVQRAAVPWAGREA